MIPVKISGLGCTLLDYVYNGVDFSGTGFQKYCSRTAGDGGLTPGQLVFLEDLEKYAGKDFDVIRRDIIGDREPDILNVGGPAVVSIIHAAQLLGEAADMRFVASIGNDREGDKILDVLSGTPLSTREFLVNESRTPFTYVLSDPSFNEGTGERTFINNIGAAGDLLPEDLPDNFLQADILCLGGTALVPGIHDALDDILINSGKSTFKLVNTVFDFRNERRYPGKPWPLGKDHRSFTYVDLLIMDRDEALKISAQSNLKEAVKYFHDSPLSVFIITNGTEPVTIGAGRRGRKVFSKPVQLPVSSALVEGLNSGEMRGDTTGAGDNFTGGVIYSIANQMADGISQPDIIEAVKWGIVSGGIACTYMGGTWIEKYRGEKLEKIKGYYSKYTEQLEREWATTNNDLRSG